MVEFRASESFLFSRLGMAWLTGSFPSLSLSGGRAGVLQGARSGPQLRPEAGSQPYQYHMEWVP